MMNIGNCRNKPPRESSNGLMPVWGAAYFAQLKYGILYLIH